MEPNPQTLPELRTQILLRFLIVMLLPFQIMGQAAIDFPYSASGNNFIRNNGQLTDMNGELADNVLFYAEYPYMDVFITTSGLTMLLLEPSLNEFQEKIYHWERVDIKLENALILEANISTSSPVSTGFNYFTADFPDGIHADEFSALTIKNIYPGIDWQLNNNGTSGLKYQFVVAPGANPNDIQLNYLAQNGITITSEGAIKIPTQLGDLLDNAPVSFYAESEKPITTNYAINTTSDTSASIQFNITSFDATQTIIIDPELYWCTYYGGNKEECFNSVTTDLDGNLIVVGWTDSPSFPVYNAGTYFQGTLATNEDAMIVKFSPDEERLWATFYGGNHEDWAYSVATDNSGNIFVSGETVSNTFPVYNAGTFYQGGLNGDEDVFILKFNSAGTRLWATFYGGDKKEGGYSIATDPSGNIFVTGYTESTDFPKLSAGTFYQATMSGVQDAFVLKFTNTGTRIWATYYGGTLYDVGNAITCDLSGNVFVTGETRSTNFPVLDGGGYYDGTMNGDTDVYVIKFSNTGVRTFSTYFGGTDAEYGNSIITDLENNIYFAGWTRSSDIPTLDLGNYYQASLSGLSDAYIVKLDNSGNLLWSTYFGGPGVENAFKWDILANDFCNNIYLAFTTFSSGMPVYDAGCSSYFDASYEAYGDIFIVRFTDSALITWATYYGYDAEELDACIGSSLIDGKSLYMTGQYNEYDPGAPVPMANPGGVAYYDGTHNGDNEAFIGKFEAVPLTLTTENSNLCFCVDTAVAIPDCGVAPYDYLWSDGQTTATAYGLCPDVYTVTVTDADCNITIGDISIICELPVDIISFNGTINNHTTHLKWTTLSESNIDYYLIEKSVDGEIFTVNGSIPSVGDNNVSTNYIHYDYIATSGTYYYALSSVDFQGNITPYGTITLPVIFDDGDFQLYQINNQQLQLHMHTTCGSDGVFSIWDTKGQLMFKQNLELNEGENNQTISIPDLSKGIYYATIVTPRKQYKGQFIRY